MKVAITYDNGEIFQSFGHTEQFKIYEVNDGMITDMQIVNANGKENGALSGFLAQAKTDVLICGGIDDNAQTESNYTAECQDLPMKPSSLM